MGSLNRIQLIGNLGRDPESRFTKSGKAVCNFTMATTDKYQDEERTEWHRIVCFGKTAELAGQYLKKGRQVYIEGRIQTKQWEGRDGQKRTDKEIIANNIVFLSTPKADAPAPSQGQMFGQGNDGRATDPFGGDDIPF